MTILNTPDIVLKLENLCIASTSSGVLLVDGLSFSLDEGKFLAIVGESGSGKTMAARSILRLLPTGVTVTGGNIYLAGESLVAASGRRLQALRGGTVGMVFQEPMVSLNPAIKVGQQMAEGLRLHTTLSATEIEARSIAMLQSVQIADPVRCLASYPHEFSGGMRQRIMLASVMMLKPRLLIADEPTTALDTLTQLEVLELMVALAKQQGTAVLLITHNLGLVAKYADNAIVMCKGKVVESGEARQILANPQDPYTKQLIEALPRRLPTVAKAPTPPVVEVRQLRVNYAVRRTSWFGKTSTHCAVDGVDLAVHQGETIAVVGGSGCGKTSLGRALLRLIPNGGGQILYQGQPIEDATGSALHEFRLACQLVFQDPYSSLNPRMRIGEIIDEPLRHLPVMSASARQQRVTEVLGEVGLPGFERRFGHELSGGQRQRVAIARAIVRRPAFVVADEPVSALDMTIQAQILRLFAELQRTHGFACLFISHDLAAVEQIADRVIVMQSGKIVEQGSRDDIFDRPQHDYTKALLAARTSV